MESGNILRQMDQYDFSTPINVTMIFEDSDEEMTNINKVKEEIEINDENSIYLYDQEKTETRNNEISNKKNMSPKKTINEQIPVNLVESQVSINSIDTGSLNNDPRPTTDKPSPTEDVRVLNNQNASTINSETQSLTEKTNLNMSAIYQQINDKEELTAYVKDLLNTLSEHLILVMQPYYHYYQKNPHAMMSPELSTQLNRLKAHFFDLSYSTVVSLILPQENNEIFIQKFIDKTVTDANKVLNWKCGRHHVEPFYQEMVEWARQKRTQIKTLALGRSNGPKPINDHSVLKEKLSNPPQLFNISPTNIALDTQNNNIRRNSDTDNSLCIFSCGSPGREVSINVNPSTLMRHTQHNTSNQYVPVNKIQRSGKIFYPPTPQAAPKQAYNDHRLRQQQHNAYNYNNIMYNRSAQSRQPPPPYGTQTYNVPTTMPQNYHQLNQIQENIQSIQNYHRNVNSFSAVAATRNNTNFGVMYNVQNEAHPSPIITSVTSLHPTSNPTSGRCCICGKMTTLKCLKCNNYSYCSYLCQELHSSTHRAKCGKAN